jgi:hypothetical protein
MNKTLGSVYRTFQSQESLNRVFHKNAVIRDNILKCKAKGIDKIRHYYNEMDYLYNEVYIVDIERNSQYNLTAHWARRKADETCYIYGTDHIIVYENKIQMIISSMDVEKTTYSVEDCDFGWDT